jgi:competence ComEA-like helix-hairpin-helix protein
LIGLARRVYQPVTTAQQGRSPLSVPVRLQRETSRYCGFYSLKCLSIHARETGVRLKLFILSVALVAAVACTRGENAANSNTASPANQSEEASSADSNRTEPCLNLNIATAANLIKLPGIGEVMAQRIVDYRARHGRFRRREEIIIIEGFSERKYRDIAGMICVE